jgi:hypothetical protein
LKTASARDENRWRIITEGERMADKPDDEARQGQGSSQSGAPGKPDGNQRKAEDDRNGDRPSAGTPDIERGGADDNEGNSDSNESLVNDPVGAFKERP